jgi:hypothetical protein
VTVICGVEREVPQQVTRFIIALDENRVLTLVVPGADQYVESAVRIGLKLCEFARLIEQARQYFCPAELKRKIYENGNLIILTSHDGATFGYLKFRWRKGNEVFNIVAHEIT